MEIAVDVGVAAEVPDEVGAFNLPGVPDFVGADVVFAAVAGDEEALDEVFVLDGFHGGGDVVGADFSARIKRQFRTAVKDGSTPGFYGGFLVGFVENPWSNCKDGCTTLLGIGKKAVQVAWLVSPVGVLWEFTFGDSYQGEIKAARQMTKKAYDAASTAYQFAKEWGGPVCGFLEKLINQSAAEVGMALRGEIPQRDKMGPELQIALDVVTQLIVMADDAWTDPEMLAYDRGYWLGYITFEVTAIVVAAVLTAPAGGAGGAAVAARHGPKVARIMGYLEKLLSRFEDVPAISKVLAKLRGFGDVAKELGRFCFIAGTPVLTACGPRSIESIDKGDWVWSRDEQMGEWGWRQVARTFVTHPDTLVRVRYHAQKEGMDEHARKGLGLVRMAVPAAGTVSFITCTPGHFVHARRKAGGLTAAFVAAGSLHAGDLLTLADGRDAMVSEVSVEEAAPGHRFTTYNFTVTGHHTYFAGEQPVWVHNDGLSPCDKIANRFFNEARAVGAEVDNLKAERFNVLRSVKMALRDDPLIGYKHWAQSGAKVSDNMFDDFNANRLAVGSLPNYQQWKNFFKQNPSGANGNDVHHIVERWIQKKLGFNGGFDDVPGCVMSGDGPAGHAQLAGKLRSAITKLDAGDPGAVINAIKLTYESKPEWAKLWPATRAWLKQAAHLQQVEF